MILRKRFNLRISALVVAGIFLLVAITGYTLPVKAAPTQGAEANWVDITTIKFDGDIYTDPKWDSESKYFLTSSNDAFKQQYLTVNKLTPGSKCLPYIQLDNDSFNVTDKDGLINTTEGVTKYSRPGAQAEVHYVEINDQNAFKSNSELCDKKEVKVNFSQSSMPNVLILFKYYPTQDVIQTIFRSGGDNESNIVNLSFTPAPDINVYAAPASGSCRSTLSKSISDVKSGNLGGTSLFTYQYLDGNSCKRGGDTPFILIAAPASETPAKATTTNTAGSDSCKGAIDSGFGWIICPALDLSDKFINAAEGVIESKLAVNTSYTANSALFTAWATMARISSVLLVVIAMAMIISTALGFSIFDAYTVKKVLPKLVIAAIGIWLSWSIISVYISIMNDLGRGIAGIMFAPFAQAYDVTFQEVDLKWIATNAMSTTGAVTDIAVNAVIFGGLVGSVIGAGGLFALLAALIPIVGAIFIGLFLLSLREILIIFCVIIAPIGIAAWILPNTNKLWKLWSGTLNKLLLLFPLFMGIFAAGKIFAVISVEAVADPNAKAGFMEVLIPMIAYVAPFFFIPALFKFAGTVFGNITGVVNNKSKGLFDKSSKAVGEFGKKRKAYKGVINDAKSYQNRNLAVKGQGFVGGSKNAFNKTRARYRIATKNIAAGSTGRGAASEIISSEVEAGMKKRANELGEMQVRNASVGAVGSIYFDKNGNQLKHVGEAMQRFAQGETITIQAADGSKQSYNYKSNPLLTQGIFNKMAGEGNIDVLRTAQATMTNPGADVELRRTISAAFNEAVTQNIQSVMPKAPDMIKGAIGAFGEFKAEDLVGWDKSTLQAAMRHISTLPPGTADRDKAWASFTSALQQIADNPNLRSRISAGQIEIISKTTTGYTDPADPTKNVAKIPDILPADFLDPSLSTQATTQLNRYNQNGTIS